MKAIQWAISVTDSDPINFIPKLCQEFSSVTCSKKRIEILLGLRDEVIQKISPEQVNDLILLRLIDLLPALLESILKGVPLLSESISSITKNTENAALVIQVFSQMIEKGQKKPPTNFGLALAGPSLTVIRNVYLHCKEIAKNDLCDEALGEKNVNLFRENRNFQMLMTKLVEELNVDVFSEENSSKLVQNLFIFEEISDVVSPMDIKIALTIWKFLSVMYFHQKRKLLPFMNIDRTFRRLQSSVSLSFSSVLAPEVKLMDKVDSQRVYKVSSFMLKLLSVMTKLFMDSVGNHICKLIDLLSLIISHELGFISFFHREHYSMVAENFTSNINEFLALLIAHPPFAAAVLSRLEEFTVEHPPAVHLALLFKILLFFSEMPKSILRYWFPPSHPSIFQKFFSVSAKCIQLFSLQQKFKSPIDSTSCSCVSDLCQQVLYHAVLVSPPSASPLTDLIEALISPHYHNALLAGDVILRLASLSHNSCLHYFHQLVSVIDVNMSRTSLVIISGLMSRLLKKLGKKTQESLLLAYPPNKSFALWCQVKLSACDAVVQVCLVSELSSWSMQKITDFKVAKKSSSQLVNNLVFAADFLSQVPAAEHVNISSNSTQIISRSLNIITRLLPLHNDNSPSLVISVLCRLIGSYIPVVQPRFYLPILQLMNDLLKTKSAYDLSLGVLTVLSAFGRKRIAPFHQQVEVLNMISSNFRLLLAPSVDAVVRLHSIATFAKFAQETVHERVISDSVAGEQQGEVVSFITMLSKKGFSHFKSPNQLLLLQQQEKYICHKIAQKLLSNGSKNQPPLKKMRPMEEARSIINNIDLNTTDLEACCSLLTFQEKIRIKSLAQRLKDLAK